MKKLKTLSFIVFISFLSGLVIFGCKKEEEQPVQDPSRMISGSRAGHYVIVNPSGGADVAEVAPNIKFVGEVSLGYMSKKAILVSPLVQGANPVLFICDATTGNNLNQLVSEDDFYVQHVDGSPVASKLVFSAKDMTNFHLHIHSINENGTGYEQLSFQDEGIECPEKSGAVSTFLVGADMPSWSPDGAKIAFNAYLREVNTNHPHNAIIVMDHDGSNKEVVFNVPMKEETHYDNISWTRDGEFLVFNMADGATRMVRALHISSGTLTNLHAQMKADGLTPQDHWTSPTQDSIVYMLDSPGGSDLFTIGYEIDGESLKVVSGPSRLTNETATGHGYTEPDWQHWDLN